MTTQEIIQNQANGLCYRQESSTVRLLEAHIITTEKVFPRIAVPSVRQYKTPFLCQYQHMFCITNKIQRDICFIQHYAERVPLVAHGKQHVYDSEIFCLVGSNQCIWCVLTALPAFYEVWAIVICFHEHLNSTLKDVKLHLVWTGNNGSLFEDRRKCWRTEGRSSPEDFSMQCVALWTKYRATTSYQLSSNGQTEQFDNVAFEQLYQKMLESSKVRTFM